MAEDGRDRDGAAVGGESNPHGDPNSDGGPNPDSESTAAAGPEQDDEPTDRRRALKYGALAALAGTVGLGTALRVLDGDDEPSPATPTSTAGPWPTASPTPAAEDDLLPLVERFAPDLYFGRRERWFPTDPRPFASESGGRTVVHGFDALGAYSSEFRASGTPPRPTVFYDVVPVVGAGAQAGSGDSTVVSLQYWLYSVFDQFAVNFHWHDWELLQVFVDVESGEPLLLSASAHARSCPNNEFLEPDFGADGRPAVLAEVGSHSSATDVNGDRPSFERLAVGDLDPDVSNGFLRPLESLVEQPFAYGLPRDEGARLPYSMPELDGHALDEHPDLDLELSDFVDQDVTVRSWGDLARPPGDLPGREPGTVLAAPGSATDADAVYDLVPLAEAAGLIDDFVGPQLSFEFTIPGFVEDRFSSHITTAGIPWEDPRSTDPASDVTDSRHRRAIAGGAPSGLTDRVVGAVSLLLDRPDGHLDAVGDEDREDVEPFVPVSLFPPPVEVACLLRSDPVATVTSGGVFRFLDVDAGAHELVVNGPGVAPCAVGFDHAGGTVRPGAGGRVALVANEDAVVLRADRSGSTGIRRVRIVESFVGPVYDGRPVEADRFAVPVHRAGSYTVEVTDRDGVRGAVRVDPERLDGEPIPVIETGKAALARSLAGSLAEAASLADEFGDGGAADRERSAPADFEVAAGDASEAADLADRGDAAAANDRLVAVVDRLVRVRRTLGDPEEASYGAAAAAVLRYRADEGVDRAEDAYGTPVTG